MKTQRVLIILLIFVMAFILLGGAMRFLQPVTVAAAPSTPDAPLTYQWDPQFGPFPGLGADDEIRAVARHPNGDIYVGGSFSSVGGVTAFRVARWDGTQWHALAGGGFNGVSGSVNAIAIDPATGYVYVGGSFANIDGYSNGPRACFVARWDPAGQWSPLADGNGYVGVSGFPVYALTVSSNYVYVGGYLNGAANSGACGSGTVAANALVRWNKATGDWSDVGGSMGDGFDMVYSLAFDGSSYVYAGGYFVQAGGVTVNNIAQWNGTSWAALGSGTDAEVKALAITGTAVYAGGFFSNAGGAAANRIAKWSGGGWSSLGGGLTTSFAGCWSAVHGIALDGTNVYATGHFNRAGGIPALNVAQWDGSGWAALGSGVGATPASCGGYNDYGDGLVHNGADLYVGGWFQEAGGSPSLYFARWTNSLAGPDLVLIKSADQITVPIGQDVMYTLQLVHDGNVATAATNVVVSDVLPAELDYVGYDATQGTYSAASGLWTVGTLNQWEAVYLNITGTVNSSAAVGQMVTNTAVIHSADQTDPNPANNQSSAAITVTAGAPPPVVDVLVDKMVTPTVAAVGEVITYTVAAVNQGAVTVTAVTLSDTLPGGVTLNGWQTTAGTYAPQTGVWSIPQLNGYELGLLTITATVNSSAAGQIVTNTAVLGSITPPDEVITNNVASAAFQAGALPAGLNVTDVSAAEGAGVLTFTVSLSPTQGQPVFVDFATSNGSAAAGVDYTAVSGTLSFSPGTSSQPIAVPILPDNLNEGNETLNLTLSNAVNAVIGNGTAVGTILDDDTVMVQINTGSSVTEAGGINTVVSFTVTLSTISSQGVDVDYATMDDTAVVNSDYLSRSGTLSFAAGVTSQTLFVPTLHDDLNEDDETFVMLLSNPQGNGVVLGNSVGIGTILDDDDIAVSASSVQVMEGSGLSTTLRFSVTLSGGSGQLVTVDYATADQTAVSSSDYVAASGTLTFTPGVTSGVVDVLLVGDTAVEPDETFLLTLSNPTGRGVSVGGGTAVGTILNDDGYNSVGDFVWFDADKDGFQDAGESGVAGVEVWLVTAVTHQIVQTTTTNASGQYSFAHLVGGSYYVQFIPPVDRRFTHQGSGTPGSSAPANTMNAANYGQTPSFTLYETDALDGLDAGLVPRIHLSGLVWHDLNGNGAQDAGEPPLAGVPITVVQAGGGSMTYRVIQTATTGSDGRYTLTDYFDVLNSVIPYPLQLRYLDWSFQSSPQVNYLGGPGLYFLPGFDPDVTGTHRLDIGYYKPITVTGVVFQDLNGNGVRETAVEPGLSVLSFADDNGNGLPDTPYSLFRANLNGLVNYPNLSPQPAPYRFLPYVSSSDWQTTVSSTFTIVSGQPMPSPQIGLYRPGSISGLIWHDVNGNGLREDDEPRLPSYALFNVRLYVNGATSWTQTTQTSDYYIFDAAPGSYVIEIEPVATTNPYQVLSPQDQGASDAVDSDFSPVTRRSGIVTLATGASSIRLDAAVHPSAGEIGGRVCNESFVGDPFINGLCGTLDAFLPQVTVNLYQNGGIVNSTQTDQSGSYTFAGLPPDTYQVGFVRPSGYLFSPDYVAAPRATNTDFWMNMVNPATGRTNLFYFGYEIVNKVTASVYAPTFTGSATPTGGGSVGGGNLAAATAVSKQTAVAANTTIHIQPGGVTTTTELYLTPISLTTAITYPLLPPLGETAVFHNFLFDTEQNGWQISDLSFANPATVTIGYTDAEITAVSDESSLELFWWDGEAWALPMAVCGPITSTVDTANNVFTGEICTAGRYGLFGSCSVTAAPPIVTATASGNDAVLSWDTDGYRGFEVWYNTQPDRDTARPLALNLTDGRFVHAGGAGSYYWVVGMNQCGSVAETAVQAPPAQSLLYLPFISR